MNIMFYIILYFVRFIVMLGMDLREIFLDLYGKQKGK